MKLRIFCNLVVIASLAALASSAFALPIVSFDEYDGPEYRNSNLDIPSNNALRFAEQATQYGHEAERLDLANFDSEFDPNDSAVEFDFTNDFGNDPVRLNQGATLHSTFGRLSHRQNTAGERSRGTYQWTTFNTPDNGAGVYDHHLAFDFDEAVTGFGTRLFDFADSTFYNYDRETGEYELEVRTTVDLLVELFLDGVSVHSTLLLDDFSQLNTNPGPVDWLSISSFGMPFDRVVLRSDVTTNAGPIVDSIVLSDVWYSRAIDVPAPATLPLFALSGLALLFMRRRRELTFESPQRP